MAGTTLSAVVRVVDLPTGTTITGVELLEVVQTASGVGQSIQIPISQIITASLGGLPTGGGTGQLLAKTSGANFVTNFSSIISFVAVGTALATTGSATSIVAFVSNQGISSTQIANGAIGSTQLGALAVQQSNITAAAVGSTQLGALAVQRTNLTSFLIGSTQIDTASVGTAQMVAGALGMTLLNTLSPSGVASTNDTTSFSSTYKHYLITFDNVVPATNTTSFQMQVATTGSAFISGSYVSIAQINVSATIVTDTSTTVMLLTGIRATTTMQTSTVYGLSGFIRFFNPAGAVSRKQMVGEVSFAGAGAALGTTTLAQATVNALFDGNSNAVTGVNFSFNSGNIATGTIKIYGSP